MVADAGTVRAVRPGDVEALAATMRAEDVAEVLASGGYSPREALEVSLSMSCEAWTWEVGGEVAAVFGIVELPRPSLLGARVGGVWALTGTAVHRHRKAFVRASRRILTVLLSRWDVLTNAVDARYTGAVRWLEALGAVVGPPQSMGVAGLPFRLFYVTQEVQHV